MTALLLCLPGQAFAQTCASLVPVQNSTFAGGTANQTLNIAPYWTATLGATQGGTGVASLTWYYSGTPGLAYHFNDYAPNTVAGRAVTVSGYNSFQQTVQGGVTGGSVIQFDLSWFNGANSAVFTPALGNRSQLDVVYAGTTYATFFTTSVGATNATKAAPAESAGAIITTAPSWTTLPDEIAAPGNSSITRVQITLPAGVPPSGQLMFRSRRNNPGATDGQNLTDDFAIRNPVILSPALCLSKQSTGGTGVFNFTVSGADTDLATAGIQTAATVTTTATNTPVSLDAWADNASPGSGASLGTTPMLVNNIGQAVAITENLQPEFALAGVTCTGGGSATVVGNTATITGVVAAATPTMCTFTNAAVTDLQITKTNTPDLGNVDQAGDTVASGTTITYTLVVSNNGPSSTNLARVRDTPVAGVTCPDSNPVTIIGSGIPAGNFTVGNLKGAGIELGLLGVGQSATLTFQCAVN